MIAAGTAAAGVCLVLALTILVVQLGAAGIARTASGRPIVASQSGNSRTSRGGLWPAASAGRTRARIAGPAIASFHGTGPARHSHFAVSSPGAWGLSWTYRCTARQPGNFQLTAKGTADDDVDLDVSGKTGRGIIWVIRDAGVHSLKVSSDCSWTARVVLPKTPSRRPTSS